VPLASAAGLTVTAIFGGVPQNPQVAALRNRTDVIIIACPGRLADLIKQGHCHLRDVEITVLDEAEVAASTLSFFSLAEVMACIGAGTPDAP
jgi:superfamily II DNA/RNA helicase